MGIEVERVELVGEYDLAREQELVSALVVETSAPTVIVDMSGVTFLDSSGIRALLRVRNRFELEHRELVLADVTPQVHDLFALLGLGTVLLGSNG